MDLETTENQIIKKFADDTKIAQFVGKDEDAAELQATLDSGQAHSLGHKMGHGVSCGEVPRHARR